MKSRHDIYSAIHKAIRGSLCENLIALGQTDYSQPAQLQISLTALKQVLELCEQHIQHENNFIHPALVCLPEVNNLQTADQHVEHQEAISELRFQIHQLENAAHSQRETLMQHLYRSFAMFVAENIEHMAIEESHNNQLLWAHYSDQQISDIENQLVMSLTPQENHSSFSLMLKYFNQPQRFQLLTDVREHAPAEVFDYVSEIARQVLTESEWQDLPLSETSRPMTVGAAQ
jgi:hypothetical protein